MASSLPHWTDELPPMVACGLLPKLPDLTALRERTDAAVRISHSGRASSSASAAPGVDLLFHAQRLHLAVRACVEADPDIPFHARSATTLLLTSVAMEDYARSHSTKARLVASHNARVARAAAEQLAGAARAAADEGESAEREERELLEFLLRSGRPQIIDRLLAVLGEPETQRVAVTRILAKYSPVDIAAILKATRLAFETGDTDRTDGSGSRTLGGVFFREVKRYKAANDRQAAQELLPPLPSLRPYQRDMVGLALSSWGLQLPEEVLARCEGEGQEEEGEEEEGGAKEALRRRALLARFRKLAGDWSGNWLVSAPTNSGKTRMFVEVARGVICSRPADGPCALVVVLVPNVILTNQHAAAFDAARLPRTVAGAYSSDSPLTSKSWGALRIAASRGGHHSVVVVTAESFVNLLRSGQALLEEVDLLVLDEAHHCKDDHPYAVVMERFYSKLSLQPRLTANGANGFANTLGGRPRVLAVTASPASEKDLTSLGRRMEELLQRLGPARLHLVDAADRGVARVLPEPSQRTVHVARRTVDRELMLHLQDVALDVTLDIEESLVGARTAGSTAAADKDRLIEALHTAVEACELNTGQLLVTRLDPLGQWLSNAREMASRYNCPNLDHGCRLLDVLRKAVELVEDAGFEGALPFLCRKIAALCRDELTANGGIGAGVRGPNIPPCPPAAEARRQMWEAVAEAQGAEAAEAEAPLGGSGGGGVVVPQVLASLAGAAAALPSAHNVAAQLETARMAATSPPPGNRCTDISVRVSELIRKRLMTGEDGLLSCCEGGDLVPDCFVSGQLKEENTFPKFWALVKYLQGYQHREQFHGVIFVRTRQAVFHITDMIRRTEQLQFMEVLELIGHNSTAKRTALAPEQDRHGRGMSDMQHQQVLALFKEPGCKVLVATSAAEEGLDVPSCEFVVRYNAAATGIQLLQSRGRARQKVAEFLAILQDGTLDSELHAKSRLEETNMHIWQRTVAARNQGAALP